MTLSGSAAAGAVVALLRPPFLLPAVVLRGALGAAATAVFRGVRGAFAVVVLVRRVVFAAVVLLVEPFLRPRRGFVSATY